jgi:hypothetical protein
MKPIKILKTNTTGETFLSKKDSKLKRVDDPKGHKINT